MEKKARSRSFVVLWVCLIALGLSSIIGILVLRGRSTAEGAAKNTGRERQEDGRARTADERKESQVGEALTIRDESQKTEKMRPEKAGAVISTAAGGQSTTAAVTVAVVEKPAVEEPSQKKAQSATGPQLVMNAAGNAAMAELLAKPVDLSNPRNREALVAQVKALEDAEKAAIETKARQLGIPTTLTRANGSVAVLRGFEDDRPIYEEHDNANAAISTNAHLVRNTAPFGVDGAGMVFGLWESGGVPRLTHQEFGGRITVRDGTVTATDHATHVGGTLAGNGTNLSALGMAPAALIHAYNSSNDVSEMLAAGAAFSGQAGKILISNHSYGSRRGWFDDGVTWLGVFSDDGNRDNDVDYGFGRYDSAAATLDGMAYNLPYYLAFFSNGNMRTRGPPSAGMTWYQGSGGQARTYDPAQHPRGNSQYKGGYDTMDGRKTAKNILSIGAANDAVLDVLRHLPSSTITSFSSTGPTDDGRIKPDIVANGASLFSAGVSSDNSYYSASGTSMSSPNAAGSAMLLADLYQRRFPGESMRASTLKALILHTADDIGNPGPDYFYGWGLMNTEAAAQMIEKQAEGNSNPPLIEGLLTTAGGVQTHLFEWNGVDPIRVTLCWTDPAAPNQTAHDVRSPALVNDLNVTVTAPNGAVFLPFVMPYVGDWREEMLSAPATRGVNNVDNVEQVLVEVPPVTGQYTVTVNHSGSLTNSQQPYSLIISGGGVPAEVVVLPIGGMISAGDEGGPFEPAEKEYTILNNGATPKSWTATVNRPWLSVVTAAGTVAAGAQTAVQVQLTAEADALPVGYHEGRLTLVVDGVQYLRSAKVEVLGYPQLVLEGAGGQPLEQGAELDLGPTPPGARDRHRVVIRNTGNDNLNLGTLSLSGENVSEFIASPPTRSVIPPGESTELLISFQPQTLGEKEATLSVPSNDAERSPFLLKVKGQGAMFPGNVQLTKVINTTLPTALPGELVSMGDYVLFSATDFAHGRELWRTDGTPEGTFLIKDIHPGVASSSPFLLTRVGNVAFFRASTAEHGQELWRTDGTLEGTFLVKDIYPGSASSSLAELVAVGDQLFFRASTLSEGAELWRSDGTEAGTMMVRDIYVGSSGSSPSSLRNINGTLFFAASHPSSGTELWKSDGTLAGTVQVADINLGAASSSPSQLFVHGGVLYFTATTATAGTELWRSDGTAAGTVQVADINPGTSSSSPFGLTALNGVLYFGATTFAQGAELWRSDGTAQGTAMVKDINLGGQSGLATTAILFPFNGQLLFAANDGVTGTELWTSNGTAAGTTRLTDLYVGASSSTPQLFTLFQGQVLFSAFTALGRELWRTDGTSAGTFQVKDIYPGSPSSSPSAFAVLDSCALFAADDGVHGRELWRSDGTENGTFMVMDTVPGANASTVINAMADVNGLLYFSANNNTTGLELWRSDGTAAGTVQVSDINSGSASSNPTGMTALPNGFVFAATTAASGTELHFSDGTSAGTRLVFDINAGSSSSTPTNLLPVGGQVLFSATTSIQGTELWKTDGTSAGTSLVRDIHPVGNSSPGNMMELGGIAYFTANDGTAGGELWRSDGTLAGTYLVKDIFEGSSGSIPQNPQVMNGLLYFSANTSTFGRELWRTDGTAAGTVLVKDINAGSFSSSPSQLTPFNGKLYFVATTAENGSELWRTDGTGPGTLLVKDLMEGVASSSITGLTVLEDRLVFAAEGADSGVELWTSDGTAAGTVLLKDIRPGSEGSSPALFARLGVHVYFTANDGVTGTELWRTDGTAVGTELVADFFPGANGSAPAKLTPSGKKLFFTATHPQLGLQLFQVDGVFPPRLEIEQLAGVPVGAGDSMAIGEVLVGGEIERELTLLNTGSLPLQVSATVVGADAAEFELDGAPSTVAKDETAIWRVRLRPTTVGAKAAQLQITSNDPERPSELIHLTGLAIPAPVLRVQALGVGVLSNGVSTVGFGSQELGAAPSVKTLEVFNDEPGSTLEVGAITVSGAHAAEYRVKRSGMATSLAGGQSASFEIEFFPFGLGNRVATLRIVSNDLDDGVFEVALIGMASAQTGPSQQIVVGEVAAQRASAGPFRLGAFATSGLPLTYQLLAGPVTLDSAGWFTPTGGAGAVTVRISQPGGTGYGPADSQVITFSIGEWPVFARLFSGPGASNMAALTPQGELWTWGYATATGVLGDATSVGRNTPTVIASAVPWRQVDSGADHMLGIKTDGSLWSWGLNANGRLGDGTTTTRTSPTAVAAGTQWVEVAAGGSHSAGIRDDGTLWTWGLNSNGQLGLGDGVERQVPTRVGAANHWKKVVCGAAFTVALTETGELWAFGLNSSGQLGDSMGIQRQSPVRVGLASDWAAVAAGNAFVLALKNDGRLWAWGQGSSGQLGLGGNTSNRPIPFQIGSETDWVAVTAGSNTAVARKRDGSVWAWGSNIDGQLADGTVSNRLQPARLVPGEGWLDACAGRYHSAVLAEDGRVFVAGEMVGFSGASPRVLTRMTDVPADWTKVSGNGAHFLALNQAGQLWGWGSNAFGQLSTGNALSKWPMTRLGGAATYLEMTGGNHNRFSNASYSITPDGRLFAAGYNTLNQLGDGTTTTRTGLVQIGGGNGWSKVAAGQNHALALRGNGLLWVWGTNSSGQLGDGSTTTRSFPIQVGTASDWADVAAGFSHSLAIKTDGSLWGWGLNSSGQVGLGNTASPQTSPVRIGTENDWLEIAAGGHSLAVKSDGSLWAWGVNSRGELGLGDQINRSLPTRVGMENHWAKVRVSRNSSVAITTDGRIFAAGSNNIGHLGNGQTVDLNTFTLVAEGGFEDAALGASALLARHQNGSLWTAGGSAFATGSAGRDRTRMLQVLPELTPQVILAPPVNARTWRPQATSGLPAQAELLSGPGEIVDGLLKFTGVEGESAAFLLWQSGDEVAWNAAPPKRVVLSGVHGVLQVWEGDVGVGDELESGGEALDFGRAVQVVSPWREFTVVNTGSAALTITEVSAIGDWEVDTAGLNTSLPIGEASTFRARFVPSEEGVRTGVIRLTSSDSDRPVFDIPVEGVGLMSPLTNSPRIVHQPSPQLLYEGAALRLEVVAVSLQPMSYQWQRNGRNLAGATTAVLVVPAVTSADAGSYSVRVSVGKALAKSASAAVTILKPARLELAVATGKSVLLDCGAVGQVTAGSWQLHSETVIASSKRVFLKGGRFLQLRGVELADAGVYRCLVTAPGGELESREIAVVVVTGPPQLVQPVTIPNGIVGAAFNHQLAVVPDLQRPANSFKVSGLPPGLKVNPQTGWITGRPTRSGSFKLTLRVGNQRGGITARSQVVIDPLPMGLAGTFVGLIEREATVNAGMGGQLELKITPRSAVSGVLQTGADRLRFRGSVLVDATGLLPPVVQVTVQRKGRPKPAPLALALSFDLTQMKVSGSVSPTDADDVAGVDGWASPWNRRHHPAHTRAGYHTLALLLDDQHLNDLAVPQGSGFGSFKIGTNGALRVRGRLSDGTPLSLAPKLGAHGEIGLYSVLYGKADPGTLLGRMDQTLGADLNSPTDNDLAGTLTWTKPDRGTRGGTLYPFGFEEVRLQVAGGTFVRTPYQLGLQDALPDLSLEFSGAGLEASTTALAVVPVSMLFANQFYVVPHVAGVSLKGSPATGSINGAFALKDPHWRDPAPVFWPRKSTYSGMIVRYPDGSYRGHGYFLLPQLPVTHPRQHPPQTLSGKVLLER